MWLIVLPGLKICRSRPCLMFGCGIRPLAHLYICQVLDTARRMATTMRALARLTMGAPAVPGVDLVEALLKRAEVAVQAVPALQAAVEEGQVWEEGAPVVRGRPWLQRCRLL